MSDNVYRIKDSSEAVNELYEKLLSACDEYSGVLTYAEIVGIMEIVKGGIVLECHEEEME